jgi:hypothetical protein
MTDQRDQLGQKRALIIGISDYTNPDFQQPDFCKNDGIGIYEIFESPKCNFSENNKFVSKVNGDDLRDAINRFFSNTTADGKRTIRSDDTLVFYLSLICINQIPIEPELFPILLFYRTCNDITPFCP